jgi:hypothetical protein
LQSVQATRKVVMVSAKQVASEGDPVSGVQVQAQIATQNIEQLAREAGHRWGLRMLAQYATRSSTVGNWPGSLEEARLMVDQIADKKLPHDERELLAMLVERGARRAWHTRASAAHVPE